MASDPKVIAVVSKVSLVESPDVRYHMISISQMLDPS